VGTPVVIPRLKGFAREDAKALRKVRRSLSHEDAKLEVNGDDLFYRKAEKAQKVRNVAQRWFNTNQKKRAATLFFF
jgi:hypothetical protein